ncbi:Crp/Fnr family transcriptional regulator [Sporosarcina soli]|uniref:Crp/Fnr family transcriptional regulator n=1 Tax=Sporosarcina soli TaxID=334736 RepID=A0ABW0TJW2_9BACL
MNISESTFREELNSSPWQSNKLEYWSSLFKVCQEKTVEKGDFIYYQGQVQPYIYLLMKGRVAVSLIANDGNERTCMIFTEGSIFGTSTAIEGGPSLLNARANENCKLKYMHRDEFINKVTHDPILSMQVTYTLSNIVKTLANIINDSSFMSAQEQIINYILKLANIFGEDTPMGKKITLKFTHQQMADLIGASRVTVSKVMGHLDKEGILLKIKGLYYVTDVERLEAFLDSF